MRVLRFIFSTLFVLVIAGAIAGVAAREILLMWGLSSLKQSVSSMRQLSVNAGPYYQECLRKGAVESENMIGAIQVRFTSSTEYVVEVVCSQFQLDPIVVATKTLPMFVTKAPGASGIIWGEDKSGVGLSVFGRSRALIVENREIRYESYVPTELGSSPLASCEGYGFSCCASDTAVGQGEQLTGVLNCPKTCFSSCVNRPVVLAFTTQPFFDPRTRELVIQNGEAIEMIYVVDVGRVAGGSLTIDFGDGQTTVGEIPRGQTSHTYTCTQGQCSYEASIKIVDGKGIESLDAPVSKLKVTVKN